MKKGANNPAQTIEDQAADESDTNFERMDTDTVDNAEP
jgi:hypothetical protein